MKKFKVVKISLNAVDRLLHMVESLVIPNSRIPSLKCKIVLLYAESPYHFEDIPKDKESPKTNRDLMSASSNSMGTEINGLPKLLNLRHISNASNGNGHSL